MGASRRDGMRRFVARRYAGEHGQGLMEYAIILGFCSVLAVGALTTLGQTIAQELIGPVVDAFP
jgi:Flp pilus assembly pilin Flp